MRLDPTPEILLFWSKNLLGVREGKEEWPEKIAASLEKTRADEEEEGAAGG